MILLRYSTRARTIEPGNQDTQAREGHNMEMWKVFFDRETGREYVAYTVRGEAQGEEKETIDLIATEQGIEPDRITTRTERR